MPTPLTLAVKSLDSNGITFALPSKPDLTVRFRFSSVNKSLNGIVVPNYATEIIINDNNEITVGSETVQDSLSLRLRISGTNYSSTRLGQMLAMIIAQSGTWYSENILSGFRPTTAPIITLP